jgi:hypothetical protein
MLALLGSLLGFVGSIIPEFFKIHQDGKDKAHELKLLELQMQQQSKNNSDKLEEIHVQSWATEGVALQQSYRRELDFSGAYAASVRPTVTYLFVVAFIVFKACAIYALMLPALPWQNAMNFVQAYQVVWGEEEAALFAGIISFWFGSRSLRRKG